MKCPTNLNFPLLTSNQNYGSPKQPISMKGRSKFVGHSTEIIWQSKIKGPLIHKKGKNQSISFEIFFCTGIKFALHSGDHGARCETSHTSRGICGTPLHLWLAFLSLSLSLSHSFGFFLETSENCCARDSTI